MIEYDMIYQIPVAEIHADFKWNIREDSNLEIEELKASIKRLGQEEPGKVSLATPEQQAQYGKKYMLNAGFRRFRAVSELKINTYKCVIKPPMTDEERIVANFTENHGRKQLNFYESMKPLVHYAKLGWSEQMVMEKLGTSRSWTQPRMMLAKMVNRGHKKIEEIGRRMDFTYDLVRTLNSVNDPADLDKKLDELLQQLEHGITKPRVVKTDVKTKLNVATMLMERTKPMRMALIEWAFGRGVPMDSWSKILNWTNGAVSDNGLLDFFDDLIHDPRQSAELKEIFDDLEKYKDNTELLYVKLAIIKENAANRTYERPVNGFPQK